MKKFLRFLVVLLLIVAAALLILGLVEPKEVVVTRTAMIKAPKDAVFQQIQYFKNWPNWDPWYKMDSAKMRITYSGTDGAEGSSFHWEGGDKTGTGDMKNLGVTGTLMNYEVDFTKPDKHSSQGIIKADDTAGMTKVTWNITVKMSFPMNAMFMFINMDKMLGGDFETGLTNMKQYVESHAGMASSGADVKEVDFPAHIYEGMRKVMGIDKMDDMSKFFMESYSALGKEMGKKISGPASAIYYTWDTVNKTTDMAAVFPVSDTTMPVKGAYFTNVPASKAYMTVLTGPYSNMMSAHMAIHEHMVVNGKKQSLVIEEYIKGPHEEKDSTKWVTNIYYLLQ